MYSFNFCVLFKIGKISEFKECYWDVVVSLFFLDIVFLIGFYKFVNIVSGFLM